MIHQNEINLTFIPVGTNWFEKWESVFLSPFPLCSEVEYEACNSSPVFMAACDHQ